MSAYSQYATNAQSMGKILFTLERIGIPLRIVESVTGDGNRGLIYSGEHFAHYEWVGDVPVFKFRQDVYNQLEQPKHFRIDFYEPIHSTVNETYYFNSLEELQKILNDRSGSFMGRVIHDCLENLFDDELNLIARYSTTLVEKANRLKMKFGK